MTQHGFVPYYAALQSEGLASEFAAAFRQKFIAGQREHGGNLFALPVREVIPHMKEEVLDQWSYVTAIEKNVLRAIEILEEGEQSSSDWDKDDAILHALEILRG